MPLKKTSVTFMLWLCGLFGLCGLHRFYVGRPGTGILWLLTLGLLGFGQLFDLFFLSSMTQQANLLNGMLMGNRNNINNANTVAPVFNVQVAVPSPPAPDELDQPTPAARPAITDMR